MDTIGQIQNLIVDKQPPPDIAGKKIGETSDPRSDGASVAKSKL